MNTLLIDIGNSRIKWAFVESLKEDNSMVFGTQGSFSENFPTSMVKLCLQHSWAINQIICSSVATIEQTNLIQHAFKKSHPNTLWKQINGADLIEKVSTSYIKPEQLGSDRRAMIIASQALFPTKNILIISAGTATTLDIITAESHHLGGWILPGFSLMKESLVLGTSRLSVDDLASEDKNLLEIGLDTSSAINHGILASQLGAIELVQQYAVRKNLTLDLFIFSGGNGRHLLNYFDQTNSNIHAIYEDNLVLKGLMAWHENN